MSGGLHRPPAGPPRADSSRLLTVGRRFVLPVSLAAFATLPAAPPVRAQSAAILVRAVARGRPLVGASVQLFQGPTAVRGTATDASGVARFVGLAAGVYRVRVESIGYRARSIDDVVVAAAEARAVEVELEEAPVELEGISVRADRIQIQRENTDFGTTVGSTALELLPVPYDPAELVALTPGARAEHVWGGANFQANSYQIDGLSANHPGLGGSLIEPSPLWVERVEVRGLGAGAEYGGFQGGQVNLVTKSGSNQFSAMLRTTLSGDALTGSNLVSSEIGSEIKDRYDFEGEVSGAFLPDRLFYYLGGSSVNRASRFLNHVDFAGVYAPDLERRKDQKVLGKLTWTPDAADELELSGSFVGTETENYGMTGYEGSGAASRYRSPTWFGSLRWRRAIGSRAVVEARLNRFSSDERTDPYGGRDQPGIQLFSLTPPYTTFGNAALTRRSAPSSTSAEVKTSLHFRTGGQEHLLQLGAQYTGGSFLDRRLRNGGMTWMPILRDGFEPSDPATWADPEQGFVPTEWGGEVRLDADVTNAAAYAQAALSFGRLLVSPGVRWGRWEGWLNPVDGPRFRAVDDQALDPRVGATLQLDEAGSWILKGHWGRYHQDMITQMFDRAGGSDVFTNQEIWYYRGPPISDPTKTFTEAERDALAQQGLFTRESTISLNETGPVVDYSQPYVDQWLVGIQKQFGSSVQFEALYTRRTNHDMIALVDRNRATNYTLFQRVRVNMGSAGGQPLPFNGGNVYMADLYIPNNAILDYLRSCALQDGCEAPAGLSFADVSRLTWNPDYVLTNAPDAERRFGQLQLTFKFSRPRWGGSLSGTFTGLEGNLDDVSGYADPAEYSPGPYVRVNEGVNAYGTLPNFSDHELKASAWGLLPGGLRGGAFLTVQSGDHYGPQFRISAQQSLYGYLANVSPYIPCSSRIPLDECPKNGGDPLPLSFFTSLEGNDVFIGPRGAPQMQQRTNLDLRLERMFELDRFDLGLALDLFNALGSKAVTEVQTLVNHGQRYYYFFDDVSTPFKRAWAGQWYGVPLERVQPRRLRLGMTVYF